MGNGELSGALGLKLLCLSGQGWRETPLRAAADAAVENKDSMKSLASSHSCLVLLLPSGNLEFKDLWCQHLHPNHPIS